MGVGECWICSTILKRTRPFNDYGETDRVTLYRFLAVGIGFMLVNTSDNGRPDFRRKKRVSILIPRCLAARMLSIVDHHM